METKKIRVAVLYGGRSGEHEVSLRSAASVIRNLDPNRFEVIPIAIAKDGTWYFNDLSLISPVTDVLPLLPDSPPVTLSAFPVTERARLVCLDPKQSGSRPAFDVVFPVIHGPLCEDGTIQGLLELAEVPYVGAGVLGSAVGMDKEVAKRLVRDSGIPVVPFVALRAPAWEQDFKNKADKIEKILRFPLFVKPANLGSSVGVHKVKSASHLKGALEDAFRYDTKVLLEKAIDAREIEMAVLENETPGAPPRVSIPGEVIPHDEFYSYDAKYVSENGATFKIPADLTLPQINEAKQIAVKVFEVIECEGMGRVDLFLDRKTGGFYFNEINTIPGFTSISMYPKLLEATGIPYAELLSRLIDLAIARHARKQKLVREHL